MLSTAVGRMIGRVAQRHIGCSNLGDGPTHQRKNSPRAERVRLSPPLTDMHTDSGDFAFGAHPEELGLSISSLLHPQGADI